MIAGVALLPLFLLAAAVPLFALRRVFGWRLVFEGEAMASWQPLRLADIFSQIAIVASVLVLARAPQVIMENTIGDHWLPVAITCLVLFGSSLVILPLHARVVFGGLSVWRKAVWLAIFSILVTGICFGISQFFVSRDSTWSERLEVVPFLLTLLVPAIGIFYLSLLLLAASGVRLVRGNIRIASEASEADKSQATHRQRLTWWRIGGAIAVTMAMSIYLANLQQWRAARDKENAILSRRADATGGDLGIIDRGPSWLRLAEKATDADIAAFAGCGELEYLEVKDAKITNSGLAQLIHFPRLRSLSVENIPVSDEGLVHLRHLPNLESLAIVKCDVKASHLVDLPDEAWLTTLDLTQTRFGDKECESLVEFPHLRTLTLNHTRISGRSIETLEKLSELTTLQLIGTQVDRCPFLPTLEYLDVSETNVDDEAASTIARLLRLHSLWLRGTNVTNASLKSLANLKHLYHLDLSDNPIDNEGIRVLAEKASVRSIDLSCTRVTGAGFAGWHSNWGFDNVILDRTPVDDEGISALISIGNIDDLSLAHTSITDAGLPHLTRIAIVELDIRGTQVTFIGLVNNRWPRLTRLRIASDRFDSQQISQLEQQLGIEVTTEKP